MLVGVLHAYSRSNTGDGLLVDLTVKRVRRLFPGCAVVVVAHDSDSFHDLDVLQWGVSDRIGQAVRGRASIALAGIGFESRAVKSLIEDADLLLAVGGGYLRGSDANESFKSLLAHVGQLRLAAKSGRPLVYLPQSIGPFGSWQRRLVTKYLSQATYVLARDDRTVDGLGPGCPVIRTPDLAVLECAEKEIPLRRPEFGRPVFVARDLPRPRSYYHLLEAASTSETFDWGVQATGLGNNDVSLTNRLSAGKYWPLSELLHADEQRVVVSTRLHGSLGALLAGHPSVHLSYERKGWGAFEDLGLGEFVLNARDADLDTIMELVSRIESDPRAYWNCVNDSLDKLRHASSSLDELLIKITKA